jgi:glycerophosphoryl diester phosphodiesterase
VTGFDRPRSALLFMSFDFDVAASAKRRFPDIETHWVVARESIPAEALADRARSAGLDGLNLDRLFPIDRDFVDTVRAAGLRLHVWTVDDAAEAGRLAEAGVDSITTNRPGWMREQLCAPA